MGCSQCKQDTKANEVVLVPNLAPVEHQAIRQTALSDLFLQLKALGFTEHTFSKNTVHEILFERMSQTWSANDTKIVHQKGVLNPINIERLKAANLYLKEQRQNQKQIGKIQLDEAMIFQCALQEEHPFPLLNFNVLGMEDYKEQVIFEKNQTGIIRSWNLGEQMLNFERIVEFADSIQQQIPNLNLKLVGICRGPAEQKPSYESSIGSNGWKNYQHIFLDQDDLNNEVLFELKFRKGWILDVDYDSNKGEVDRHNILSTILIVDGVVVWKKYDNEWNFASDADEIEEELKVYLKDPSKAKRNQHINGVEDKVHLAPNTYKQLRATLKTLPTTFNKEKYSRNFNIRLLKTVTYQNGEKASVSIMQPQIHLASTPKYEQATQSLAKSLSTFTEVKCLHWDKRQLISKLEATIKANKLDVRLRKFHCRVEQLMKELQVVVVGHIRAESWTKLFQAFIEKVGLNQDIVDDVIETWFPIEDKISSLSLLAIMGKIYGLQLERKDLLVVDKANNIIRIESSRKVQRLEDLLQPMADVQKQPYSNELSWTKLKEWVYKTDPSQIHYDMGLQSDLDKVEILCQQNVSKVWDFVNGKQEYSETFGNPFFNEKLNLPKEIMDLKRQMQS